MSRTIAIGDIHGCADALQCLLDELQPGPDDSVIGLGDYVDRGMDSARVIETLIDLVSKTRFIPLIGNHELMMYHGLYGEKKDLEYWYQHGGNATIASYGGRVENIPQHHLTFLSHCVRYHQSEQHFFVHANYDPQLSLDEQSDETLFWRHLNMSLPRPHVNGKIAVVGHTPQGDGQVVNFGHLVAIDTYCYGDQWLTAYDVESGKIWQANNLGNLRTSRIDEASRGPEYQT